jgi:hypothetical protein
VVTVDTSDFRRGGTVRVTVACTVNTKGLLGVRLPGSITTRATSSSPLDLYRQISLRFREPARAPIEDQDGCAR